MSLKSFGILCNILINYARDLIANLHIWRFIKVARIAFMRWISRLKIRHIVLSSIDRKYQSVFWPLMSGNRLWNHLR